MTDRPFFSVIIPTLDEEKYLPQLLNDLIDQTYEGKIEVIHVDGQSTDKTVAVAQKFSDKLNIVTVIASQKNVSHQRNLGAEKANGEWLLFMDADTRIGPAFLDGLKYQLAANPKLSVFTTQLTTDEQQRGDRAIEIAFNLGLELAHQFGKPSAFGALIGVNYLVMKKVKFNPEIKVLEDSFFVREATKKGFKFGVFSEPKYVFSLRRFRREGTLKLMTSITRMQLKNIMNDSKIDTDLGYSMVGGSYYDQSKPSVFKEIQSFLATASKKQLDSTKKLLQKLMN